MEHLQYPNESAEYRAARSALLDDEMALRAQIETVAARRRALPPGGEVPEDYVFERIGKTSMASVQVAKSSGRYSGSRSLRLPIRNAGFISRTRAMLACSFSCTALTAFALLGRMPAPLLVAVFALLGFSTGAVSIVLAHGRSLVPPHLLGRTMTLLNIGTMGGGFVVQLISGAVIELFAGEGGAYPLIAYQVVFGLQAAFMLVALAVYFGSREGKLSDHERKPREPSV